MLAHAIVFYFFSIITIFSSIMVISAKNTIHAVFFLILDFVSISCLFIMLGAEFLGMITLIVYVGAVAVLFLFVVMMININFSELKSGFLNYLPFGSLIGLVILLELFIMVGAWKYKPEFLNTSDLTFSKNISNTESIGNVIYTDYIHYFQISGVILLVAMIGAILLTFQKRDFLKRQSITDQVSRERSDSVIIKKVESFKGVKIDD
ncbi:MAG: NADH:ubiquinone oxidoreductase subunit J [Candidatus Pelagibacter sp.]|nr:NADH:ubiquinone oxidoreductase subunit J [Candidatus Pelagibacter sp.]OUV97416.1 MAG: NADH:ubiquinone oxidoreductase subunit J [Candidatus Pelagibacter sp. TMED142]